MRGKALLHAGPPVATVQPGPKPATPLAVVTINVIAASTVPRTEVGGSLAADVVCVQEIATAADGAGRLTRTRRPFG